MDVESFVEPVCGHGLRLRFDASSTNRYRLGYAQHPPDLFLLVVRRPRDSTEQRLVR